MKAVTLYCHPSRYEKVRRVAQRVIGDDVEVVTSVYCREGEVLAGTEDGQLVGFWNVPPGPRGTTLDPVGIDPIGDIHDREGQGLGLGNRPGG